MSPVRDPHAVLGVEPSAGDEEIRTAYRNRSMLLHPDLHEGRPERVRREAERAMTQLTEAYEILTRHASPGSRRRVSNAPDGPSEPSLFRLGRLVGRAVKPEAGEGHPTLAFRLGRRLGRGGRS